MISTISGGNSEKNEATNEKDYADFEKAISATKFGKFNMLLLVIAFPATLSAQFESTSLAYVFPRAQCDLELSLENKGLLNATFYMGMTISAFFWGYLGDTLGRKPIIVTGLLMEVFVILGTTFSQNLTLLLVMKFLGGFIITGPTTLLPTYLSEFHGVKYRSRIPLTVGTLYGVANICLPLVGWAVLSLDFEFNIYTDHIKFYAWSMYLLIFALAPLVSAVSFTFMPESPKYLMTVGRKSDALLVYQHIHKMNTGSAAYPVAHLVDEKDHKKGWQQVTPIFHEPYLLHICLICFLNFLLMGAINTLRLWLPEIFQNINDYEMANTETTSLCNMITIRTPQNDTSETCSVNLDNSSVYTKSMTMALFMMLAYISVGAVINIFGKKKILFTMATVAAVSAMLIYFSINSAMAMVFIISNIACSCVCFDVLLAVVIDLFPTTLRASAVSLLMMFGRVGSVLGNLLFPFLLQAGCAPPFFTTSFVIFACAILCLFLPNTNMKALE